LIAGILVFGYGCDLNSDIQVVDFTKTVSLEQPKERLHNTRTLRVAVGAMVSPKETFTYHRKVLDHIGKHLNRDIEFIQRKTYGEVNQLFGKGMIDLAFICSGPYALGKVRYGFELLATPQVQGSHSFLPSYPSANIQLYNNDPQRQKCEVSFARTLVPGNLH
jgi:phosphonate transport system substrate-binding protein